MFYYKGIQDSTIVKNIAQGTMVFYDPGKNITDFPIAMGNIEIGKSALDLV